MTTKQTLKTFFQTGDVPTQSQFEALINSTFGSLDEIVEVSPNLFDPDDSDVALGSFVRNADGQLQANSSYNTTGFVPVSGGQAYTVSYKSFLAWYDASKNYISGSPSTDTNATQTAPANAAFGRFSVNDPVQWAQFSIAEGSSVLNPYKAYGSTAKSSLQMTIDNVNFFTPSPNLLNKDTVTNGSMLADGSVNNTGSFATKVHSDFIAVEPNTTYSGAGGDNGATTMRFHTFFNSSQTVIGGSNSAVQVFTTPANTAFVRISFEGSAIENFQFEKGAIPTPYLPPGFTFAPGPLNVPIEGIDVSKVSFLEASRNLFNPDTVEAGFMGTTGALTASTVYHVSDFIEVEPNQTYFGENESGSANMRFHAFFNASKVNITGGSNSPGNTFVTPAGASYVRITVLNEVVTSFQLEKGGVKTAFVENGYTFVPGRLIVSREPFKSSVWSGKLWASLGDSITSQNRWQPYVATGLGIQSSAGTYGEGGTTLCVRTDNSNSTTAIVSDTRINAIPADRDLVTVMAGTNDWAQNFPLGAETSSNESEFYGALNSLVSKLQARFTSGKIALATPPFGAFPVWQGRPGWTGPETNAVGLTTADYAEAVRKVCLNNDLICIDVHGLCEVGLDNNNEFNPDNIHPSIVHGQRIARVYIDFLRMLAPAS